MVVIESGTAAGLMVREKLVWTNCAVDTQESVTRTVKVEVPATVGVPLS